MNENQSQNDSLNNSTVGAIMAGANAAANEATQTAVQMAILRERHDTMRDQLFKMARIQDEMTTKLDTVLTTMAEARGGWRTVVWLGSVSAAVGALLGWGLQHIRLS